MQTPTPPAQAYDDEIDLRQLVAVLLRQKALIAGIGIFGAALGLGASLLSTKYVTDGLFLTPDVPASNYKRYENVLTNGTRLQQYLQTTKQADSTDGQLLHALAENPDKLGSMLKPEFVFTEQDQKSFGIRVNDENAGNMVGVRIQFAHKEPTGGTPVIMLAEYVRDSIIRVDLEDIVLTSCNDFSMREQKLRNAQLQNDFAIRQEETRLANLRSIIARNPEASAINDRQIVSLEKGSERFLSPAAQVVASEIQIADMRLADTYREREQIASALRRDYYCQAQQTLQQSTTGRAFLGELKNIQATVFQNQDKSIDVIEQTWNELDVERESWASTYLSRMRFVASPESTEIKERKPGLALGIALGSALGGMLGMLVALCRAWWRSGRDETVSKA